MKQSTLFISVGTFGAFALCTTAGPLPAFASPTLPLPPPLKVHGFLIRPGVQSPIVVQTTPGAACFLYPEGHNDARYRHRLDADDSGLVRVFAKSHAAMRHDLRLALNCTRADGRSDTYPLTIRADANAPLPSPQRPFAPLGMLRPPLGQNALALSDRELVLRGYPPRPDKVKAPGPYAKWLYIVSHSFTQVGSRKVGRHDISFAPTLPLPPPRSLHSRNNGKPIFDYTSGNWSGAVVSDPNVRFYEIQDDWLTPSVSVPTSIGSGAAAVWAGLDDGPGDLVQAGTDSEAWNFFYYDFPIFNVVDFTNYWAWVENLPDVPYAVPNMSVSPGDELSVEIFLADQYGNTSFSNGDLTPSDDSVWFMVYNLTAGTSWWGTLPRQPQFTGATAEFVLERPQDLDSGTPVPLADYGIANAHDCWFADTWSGFESLDYNGTPPYPFTLDNLTMVNGPDTLSNSFTYPNNSGGGGNEFWAWQNYL